MKEIPLTRGMVAIVDDQDFEALSAHKWCAYRSRCTYYARRYVPRPGGGKSQERMHQVVLARKIGRPIAVGMECDHHNGDGLDNQRENLFEVTKAQNQRNCRRHAANPSSQYLGVNWEKSRGTWRARVKVSGKQIHLGYYATELEAAQAREAFIGEQPELNARTNFPKETPWTPA